ncbi:MAG: hypothetical protein AAFR93_13340, partial [Pseudomonadota bacterium]
MTAEIAILNKSAVVLAADSAVTIGSGGNAKIFNTANKIFELSDDNAIALMVFNRLDFMDLPIEVLAKEYRRVRSGTSFSTVNACKQDFLRFLSNEVAISDNDRRNNFATVCFDTMGQISVQFQRALDDHIRQTRKVLVSKFNGILKSVVESETISFGKAFELGNFGLNYAFQNAIKL